VEAILGMKMLELLEFKIKLNDLIKHKSFEQIFNEAGAQFFNDFGEFVSSIVGRKWLKQSEGKRYGHWQNG